MTLADVRALYDRHQRLETSDPNVRLITSDRTVRLLAPSIQRGVVIHSRLTAADADVVIAAEVAFFQSQPMITSLEWKVFDYDAPADLLERLHAQGFISEPADAICVLELATMPDRLRQPITHDIRQITDPTALEDVIAVQAVVWGADNEWISNGWLRATLTDSLTSAPDSIGVYVAYVDGMPACSAWIDYGTTSPFSGLWGGSTVEAYRGRGLYTDMLAIRAQTALARGVGYLTIDASPMSRAIVEKQGFEFMAYAWECSLEW